MGSSGDFNFNQAFYVFFCRDGHGIKFDFSKLKSGEVSAVAWDGPPTMLTDAGLRGIAALRSGLDADPAMGPCRVIKFTPSEVK